MDSEKCRALVTAVELGSMSAAAQQLGYTASGITRMINALEAELGITLIARTSRGVALTSRVMFDTGEHAVFFEF